MTAASTMEASASHSVRTASTMEALASMESPVTTTGEAAVVGMPLPAVDAVIDMVVVVSFMMPPVTKVSPITVPPISKVIPVLKVTIVVKIIVEVAVERDRCVAHGKR